MQLEQSVKQRVVRKSALPTKQLWSVCQTLRGKSIMIIGGTGFLGRVMLYMLLKFAPEIKKIYVLIRPTHSRSAQDRFQKELLSSPVFSQNKGDPEFFAQSSAQKVEIVEGDAAQVKFGLSDEEAAKLHSKLDLVLNTAGNVEFNPPIDLSLHANTIAAQEVLAFTAKTAGKKYVHISTCYAADRSLGRSTLPEEHIASQLTTDSGSSIEIAPAAHIKEALAQVQAIKDAHEQEGEKLKTDSGRSLKAKLEEEARLELERLGQDSSSPRMIERTLKSMRSKKMREELIALGRRRAKAIKRPNVYTYTKTLAELLVQSYASQLDSVIVRPSIVETALRYPFPGWNEGIQGTAPLVYLAYRGHRMFPTLSKENGEAKAALLDCIPVDEVASGTVLAMCALLQGKHKAVYQLAAGLQKSPLTVATFTHISNNIREEKARNEAGLRSWLQRNVQPYAVDAETFQRFSSPRTLQLLSRIRKGVDRLSSIEDEDLSESSQEFRQKLRVNLERFYQISQVKK